VTVTNTGTAAAAVSSIAASGDFKPDQHLRYSIAAGGSCTVSVSFRPTAAGPRTGSLTVASTATNSPGTVALSGTGAGTVAANLAAGRPTSESLAQRCVPVLEHHRRQPVLLLGEHQQRVPAMGPGRPRLVAVGHPGRPAAAGGLGCA